MHCDHSRNGSYDNLNAYYSLIVDNIAMKNTRWSAKEIELMRRDYLNMSNKQIAQILARTEGSVKTQGCKLGLSTPYMSYYKNETFFNHIDNELKAYTLGFLFADGYVSNNEQYLSLQLNARDKAILKEIRDCIAPSMPLRYYAHVDRKRGKQYQSVYFSIGSKVLCRQLIRLGMDTKTQIRGLPKELEYHFIRGLFDGDGCIFLRKSDHSYRWLLLGERPLLEWVQDKLIESCDVGKNKIYKKGGIWCLEYGGNRQVRRIKHYLYNNTTIYLQRKFKNFPTMRE